MIGWNCYQSSNLPLHKDLYSLRGCSVETGENAVTSRVETAKDKNEFLCREFNEHPCLFVL